MRYCQPLRGALLPQAYTIRAMTFSVVIAAYNAADTLGETIGSVLTQTRQDFEVIVIDDGSSDGTAAIAEGFGADGRVRVYSQHNAGPSAARNRAIALARGKYISMLDSDDLWLPDYLAQMGRALDENPQAGLAYASAWRLEEISGRFYRETTAMRRRHPPAPTLPREQFIAALLRSNFVSGAVTVRHAALERVGGFDVDMTHGEDYELWLRIVISGFAPVRITDQLAIVRVRPGSASANTPAMIAGQRAVYRAVLDRHPASGAVRELTKARLMEFDEALDRRTSRTGRIGFAVRRMLSATTRRARAHWLFQSAPPADVVEAFPGLGLGRRASRASAAPRSGL